MRLLIPGSKPVEVLDQSALGRCLDREPMRRRDAVLRFYGLVDGDMTEDAPLAHQDQ